MASDGPEKANVHLEKHAHSSMTRSKKQRDGNDFVHFLRQVHRTETGKVTGKVAMREVLKARQGKRTGYFVRASQKEVARSENHVKMYIFQNVQESKHQVDANSETSVYSNTRSLHE